MLCHLGDVHRDKGLDAKATDLAGAPDVVDAVLASNGEAAARAARDHAAHARTATLNRFLDKI